MIQRRRSRVESRPVGAEIALSPDIPDQREPGPEPGRVEEGPGWTTDAWETEFVDTSYISIDEQKPPMTLELDCLYRDILKDLKRHLNSPMGCPTCGIEGEIYNTAKDSIKYLVSLLSENISYKNKVNALEREIDRYVTQMAEYKRIAETALLGRNNPMEILSANMIEETEPPIPRPGPNRYPSLEPSRTVEATASAPAGDDTIRTEAEWLEMLREITGNRGTRR